MWAGLFLLIDPGDKPLAINDDLTPMSNAMHPHLKTSQSMLHSEKEVEDAVESQASQLNNLKRKSESFREGEATSKKSRVDEDKEGVSGTDS